jgi:hypothetical protein
VIEFLIDKLRKEMQPNMTPRLTQEQSCSRVQEPSALQ